MLNLFIEENIVGPYSHEIFELCKRLQAEYSYAEYQYNMQHTSSETLLSTFLQNSRVSWMFGNAGNDVRARMGRHAG